MRRILSPANLIRLAALLAALSSGANSFADGKGSQFGLVYGLSVPDAENTKTYHMMGVKGDAFLVPNFSLGGYFFLSDTSGQLDSDNKFYYSLTGVQTAYHMNASSGDTFVAFRVGVTKLTQTQSSTDLVFSPYHYGVALGYDFPLGSVFSFGFEGSYLHALPGRTDLNNVTYESKSFNIISFLVSLQFRL